LRQFAEALLGDAGDAWPVARALGERTPHAGTVRHAESGRVFNLVASPHPNGGAVIFFDDVTSFHALEDRYRDLMERASDAIYTLDRQATITSANAATSALLDMPRDQLIGRSMIPFIDPAELDALRSHFHAARAGEPRRYECHLVRADGSKRLLSVSNTPIREGEEVVGILGIARDVTDERDAGVALQRAEARYVRLVESASDSIFTVDEEGVFTSVNRALEGGVGRVRGELLGRHFTEIFDERDRGTVWEMFTETLKGESVRREVRYHGAAGTSATANIVTAPIIDASRVVGALAILRDVTEERALMAQFVRQERLAALGQLVSGVAHELNNPLASISAHAQLVDHAIATGEDAHEAARVIAAEAVRASKIVGKLLTFVRQGDTERMRVDLNLVLRDTIELRSYGLGVQQIELVTRFDEHLPGVDGDPSQLQQVFVNLLANAEQAVIAGAQSRRVEVATEHVSGKVRVTVRDSGVGIPPEHIDRIFNPFFTTKPRGLGTGLGLSISDGIVREHGGRLYVQSSPGAGTTFLVELPVSGSGTR
jgi:PAS domain S-box-containing protein